MTKKLLENNKVEITTVAQVDRYQGFSEYSQIECEMIVEELRNSRQNSKIEIHKL